MRTAAQGFLRFRQLGGLTFLLVGFNKWSKRFVIGRYRNWPLHNLKLFNAFFCLLQLRIVTLAHLPLRWIFRFILWLFFPFLLTILHAQPLWLIYSMNCRSKLLWRGLECLLVVIFIPNLVDWILDDRRIVVKVSCFLKVDDLPNELMLRERLAVWLTRRDFLSLFMRAF